MTHVWTQTMGRFRPSFATDEKHGTVITTELENSELGEAIIKDHMNRSSIGRFRDGYDVVDYGDELKIYVLRRSRLHWDLLVNLQYEGENTHEP